MPKRVPDRSGFKDWASTKPDPGWDLLPLTHITRGISAEDIISEGGIEPIDESLGDPSAFLFYARPAYRVGKDEIVNLEAACPVCFIFKGSLLSNASGIYAFDTGAFMNRMYSHILIEEMRIHDFSLGTEANTPNRLINHVFGSKENYIINDKSRLNSPESLADPGELLARAYLALLASHGRNEPDDRVGSIEIVFREKIALANNLKAVIVPHTLWQSDKKAKWLISLTELKVEVFPYNFTPGRTPDHYHTLLEAIVLDVYRNWGII